MDHLLSREKSVRKKTVRGGKPLIVLALLLFSFERLGSLSVKEKSGSFFLHGIKKVFEKWIIL